MGYVGEINSFPAENAQEMNDKKIMLAFINRFPNVLSRENEIAHISSSAFIMNPGLDKALLAHHNIRGVWAWAGGHADGEENLLQAAIKEAKEETGVQNIKPMHENIAAIDILPVYGHFKNGKYVSAHLHLNVTYLFICEESEKLSSRPGENTGVAWFGADWFTPGNLDASDVYLYNKLIGRARQINGKL